MYVVAQQTSTDKCWEKMYYELYRFVLGVNRGYEE